MKVDDGLYVYMYTHIYIYTEAHIRIDTEWLQFVQVIYMYRSHMCGIHEHIHCFFLCTVRNLPGHSVPSSGRERHAKRARHVPLGAARALSLVSAVCIPKFIHIQNSIQRSPMSA